jgi:hypothetical protein
MSLEPNSDERLIMNSHILQKERETMSDLWYSYSYIIIPIKNVDTQYI